MDYKEKLLETLNSDREERGKKNEALVEEWLKTEGEEEIRGQAERDPLIDFERKRAEVKETLLQFLEAAEGRETIATAYDLLRKHRDEVMTPAEQKEMYRELSEGEQELAKKEQEMKESSFQYEQEVPVATYLNTPQSFLDAFQKVANLLYERKDFENASALYTFLVMYNHLNRNYWLGLGHSFLQMHKYEEAQLAYYQSAVLSGSDPLPLLYLTHSSLKKGETDYAKTLITYTEELLHQHPDEEAQKLLDYLKTQAT